MHHNAGDTPKLEAQTGNQTRSQGFCQTPNGVCHPQILELTPALKQSVETLQNFAALNFDFTAMKL